MEQNKPIKIGHYADIQAIINQHTGKKTMESILHSIVEAFTNSTVDGVILAGDIFDVQNPKDSERELIYTHIVEILKIPTLKFFGVLLGNHDYLDPSKNKDYFTDSNPIDVLTKIIEKVDPILKGKLVYLKHQTKYDVPGFDNIKLFPYSLEDGKSIGDKMQAYLKQPEALNPFDLNITIHHDILKQYVDISKLPVPKSKYEKLANLATDFHTEFILAGDIHERISLTATTESGENRVYDYPGNIFERNYGEGSYGIIRKNIEYKPAQDKGVLVHTFTHNNGSWTKSTETVLLPSLVKYLTIDCNTIKKIDNVGDSITKVLHRFIEQPGLVNNFIRFKMSQSYAASENQLRRFVENLSDEVQIPMEVDFIWDKKVVQMKNEVVDTMKLETLKGDLASGNITEQEFQALKMYIVDKLDKDTISAELDVNFDELLSSETAHKHVISNSLVVDTLSADNVDSQLSNILLDKQKLITLFEVQLKELKPTILKSTGTDKLADEVIQEVLSRFKSELEFFYFDRRQFKIELQKIQTNGFGPLSQNEIYLDSPGLTRINGTNGVGKTTLYNMIRWTIRGLLFPTMKANQIVKNTLHIFNINKPEEDKVWTQLTTNINGLKVVIRREAERVWKPKAITNTSLKSSPDWYDYVQTVLRKVMVYIYQDGDENNPIVLEGVNAEDKLNEWFDQGVDTTMFIDKFSIPILLNKPGNELADTIMSYMAPYLKPMEANLKAVKEAYNVKRPTFTLAQINDDIQNANRNLIEAETFLADVDDKINQNRADFVDTETQINKINTELHNLGNVPELIKVKQEQIESINNQITLIETEIANFQPKEMPVFTGIMPDIVEFKNKKEAQLSIVNGINEQINLGKPKLVEFKDVYNNQFIAWQNESDKHIDALKTEINDVKNGLNKYVQDIMLTINNHINEARMTETTNRYTLQEYLNNQKATIESEINVLKADNATITKNINKLQADKSNTVCSHCLRQFDNIDDEFLAHIDSQIANEQQAITDNNKLIETKEQQLIKYNVTILESINVDNYESAIVKELINKYQQSVNHLNQVNQLTRNIHFSNFKEFAETLNNGNIPSTTENWNKWLTVWEDSISNGIITANDNYHPQLLLDVISKNNSTFVFYSNLRSKLINIDTDIETVSGLELDDSEIITKMIANKKMYLQIRNMLTILEQQRDSENVILNGIIEDWNTMNQKYNESLNHHNQEVQSVQQYNNTITDKTQELHTTKTQLKNYQIELTDLQDLKLPEYNSKVKKFEELRELLQTINNGHNELFNNKLNHNNTITNVKNVIDGLKIKEQEYFDYIKNNSIYSIYEIMIKKHFKNDIFAYYREFLNSTMNLLLEDAKFKLVWHEDGDLYFTENRDGRLIYIPVMMISGMQTIFLGLSLLFTFSLLNTNSNINTIFIDEISGSLNNGEGLKHTDNIIDYQQQLISLLFKFKNKNIFIIDHVIKNLYETEAYEVIATPEGSKYMQL